MREYNIILEQQRAEILKMWLKDSNIRYEPSACGDDIYISIIATEDQVQDINNKLDTLFN